MPHNVGVACFLEAVGQYLDAREIGDKEGEARAAIETEERLREAITACMDRPADRLTAEQLGRIRRAIEPTVEAWLRDYGIARDKSHGQLVNRVVAAVVAMHQCSILVVQPVGRE